VQIIKQKQNMKLTKRQFDLLIEGLDAIEKAKVSSTLSSSILTMMMADNREEALEKMELKKAEMEVDIGRSKKELIVLKAKLYEAEEELVNFGFEPVQDNA
jgi:hypothetical protein